MRKPGDERFGKYQRALLLQFTRRRWISDFWLYRVLFSPGEVPESYMYPYAERLVRRGFLRREGWGYARAIKVAAIKKLLNKRSAVADGK